LFDLSEDYFLKPEQILKVEVEDISSETVVITLTDGSTIKVSKY